MAATPTAPVTATAMERDMSTTNPAAMASDTTTTMPGPFPVAMDKEDVLLDTVRSVDTDTVTPIPTLDPSNNVYEYRLALTTSNIGFFVPSSCESVNRR